MAPIKFEEHSKRTLEERKIAPSATAWDKISAQLESAPKKKKPAFLWYGVAASFIGVLIVSIWFFKSEAPAVLPEENNVVTVKKEVITPAKIKEQETPIVSTKNEIRNTQVENEENTDVEAVKNEFKIKDEAVTVAANEEVGDQTKTAPALKDTEQIIAQKIQDVVAQARHLEQNNEALSDAEVDSLLRKAQKEILFNKLLTKNNSVDAMALLSEVEGELNQSFRDQIFTKLKTGFFKVRNAVADRNN